MLTPAHYLRYILLFALLCILLLSLRGSRLSQLQSPGPNVWPNKIWQTWKTGPSFLSDEEKERVKTWHDLNPGYRYELLTDESAEAFVQQHFEGEPLLKDTFLNLKDNILRADFLRYLVLLAEGGVYTDLDTTCLSPIPTWIPPTLIPRTAYTAIFAIENDRPPREADWKIYADYSPYIFRLENWTLASRRNHPLLRHVALSVARNLKALAASKGQTLDTMTDVDYKAVIETTGPMALTKAFFEWASESTGREWTWRDLTMLEEPQLVGDVVVLPIRAMSVVDADREGEGAHSYKWESVVRHWSVGSWKEGHPQVGGSEPPRESEGEGGGG